MIDRIKILREIGDLAPDTLISEQGLADLLHKHKVSIQRAVGRGELPPPVRFFGQSVWTVQTVRDHLTKRLEKAKADAERLERRIAKLSV